jgi:HD-GYP domain-containing protein (c-di-GMP phosphodiesterase class II)
VRQGRPVIMDDPRRSSRLTDSEHQMLRKAGLKSALVAPMLWRNELIGTLAVACKPEGALGPRDAQLVNAIATQVTAIVSLETLVEKLRSASGRLSQAHMETVMLLAAAAEAHDRTTGEHLQNVRVISERLALELGHDEESARQIGLAAVLHDMGKIRVADSVLGNTGRLTEAEWELMKHHAVWGEQFLAGRAGFELAASIARSHHERWDGGGYPDGLGAEEIPEPATIVSVADSFDAMTSDRPYRAGRSIAAAMQELVACSGSQFSPVVVEAMARLHKRRKLPSPRRVVTQEQAA